VIKIKTVIPEKNWSPIQRLAVAQRLMAQEKIDTSRKIDSKNGGKINEILQIK
jgi:hypothetical protein